MQIIVTDENIETPEMYFSSNVEYMFEKLSHTQQKYHS